MLDFSAAWLAMVHHPLFGVAVTLLAYQGALYCYERTGWLLLNPVLVAVLVVLLVLVTLGIPYEEYHRNTAVIALILGPATVALAVPLYLNLRRIRQLLVPILVTLAVGGVFTTLLGVALAWALGAGPSILLTMAPKSVTTPISMLVSQEIGGLPALSAVFVLITGVLGAIVGPELMGLAKVRHPAAQGLALGLTAHAAGTARAIQEGEECGAFAALGMSLMGTATAVFLPLLVPLIS